MKICSVGEMRAMDKKAIRQYNIPQEILMENAGEAVYFAIRDKIGTQGKNFVIVCGSGNNGGDGFVLARKLYSMEGHVRVFLLGDTAKMKGAALLNRKIAQQLGLEIITKFSMRVLETAVQNSDCIVDALFGTGLDREIGGRYRDIIAVINRYATTVVSLDIPSGINGDTGAELGIAVQADMTVTFGLPKYGNLLYPGYQNGGSLYVTHISFPPQMYNDRALQVMTNDPLPLPVRKPDAHKGDAGKAMFIAGAVKYLGAPFFAANSFLKSGGGLAYLATPATISPFIAMKGSEIVMLPLQTNAEGSIAAQNKKPILEQTKENDFAVIGPGLSLNPETQDLARELIQKIKIPLLIDGDGISAIANHPDIIKQRKSGTVLTPHPGEMARLTGKTIKEIEQNRLDILQKTAADLGAVIVLKGANSMVCSPDGNTYINLSGNPGMATAGSGDVLTGVIAALFCAGYDLLDAARMGVFMHGLGGDFAAAENGEDSMTAGDIMEALPAAFRQMRDAEIDIYKNHYGCIHVI